MVRVSIDLTSVQTFIDIRNERMREFVFAGNDSATVTAQIDLAALQSLPVGGSGAIETTVTLSLLGTDVPLETELYVLRVAQDRVLVATDGMVFLNMVEAGIDDGITELMGLAKLSGITRTAPITARFMFTASDEASAAPAAEIAAAPQTAMAGGRQSRPAGVQEMQGLSQA